MELQVEPVATNYKLLRALIVGSFIVTDGWQLYLMFRNILMLRNSAETPSELEISQVLYDKMQMITQYECERYLLSTIIRLYVKIVKCACSYFPYIWMLTEDYKFGRFDRLVGRAMLFIAMDQCVEVVVGIPLVFLSSVLTGLGNPLFLVFDQLVDLAFRGMIASLSTYGVIYIVDRFGVVSIVAIGLLINGFGLVFMTFFYKCLMPYNYEILVDDETGRSILNLAEEVGFPADAIYVDTRSSEPSATYSTAIFSSSVVIAQRLLNLVEVPQATSVVAHELGHWASCDRLYTDIAKTIEILAIGYFWILSFGSPKLYKIFQIHPDAHPIIPTYIAFYFMWPTFTNLFHGLVNVFKAQCEFAADDYACTVRSSQNLRGALKKTALHLKGFPFLDSWFTAWFVGRPSIVSRIRRLNKWKTETQNTTIN